MKQSFLLFTVIFTLSLYTCTSENVKKSLDDNREDNGDANEETKDESLEIATPEAPVHCATRRQNSNVHELRKAETKEFPFMAAVFSQQNEFLCSGAVIANGLVITTASCLQSSIGYVLLNAVKDKRDNSSVKMQVLKIEKFPTYNPNTNSKNVGLIYIEKHNSSVASQLKISNYTNHNEITDFVALGYGLNVELGQIKELQYVGLENRVSIIKDEDILGYIDCIDTKVPSCFRDSGGPAIYDSEMIGIVVKGQQDCVSAITSEYSVNKLMATVLPAYVFKGWLDEKIFKNKEEAQATLSVYPVKPVAVIKKYRSRAGKIVYSSCLYLFIIILNLKQFLYIFV